MTAHVTRYVLTHVGRDGLRTLSLGAQGRRTFATEAKAEALLASFLANNPADRIVEVYGPQAAGTFRVRPCDCWAGHFDPVGVYFD